jgi:leucyl-tRNA synthetase
MYKNGLAYKKEANVNWCPNDQTVLANEQAQNGVCERCGTPVVQLPLKQWFWKITDYAQCLLNGLNDLDWPEKTKIMQRNWIGRSEGAEIVFDVADTKRGFIGPINWPEISDTLTPDLNRGLTHLNRGLTDEWKARIHSRVRTVHLIFSPYARGSVFSEKPYAEMILRILEDIARRHDIVLHEAAAMPDHIHLLVSFAEGRHLEKDIVKKLKGASSREFLKKNAFEDGHLWAEKKHFVDVVDKNQFETVIAYIQNNPKKDAIDPMNRILSSLPQQVTVFTTRPDTLFGVTYVVLAPEHPLVEVITTADRKSAVKKYQESVKKKTELERTELNKSKTGEPTGAFALHPVTGEKIPVWIADYALITYGTGAVMAVPGHDERDYDFAKEFTLPIKEVLQGGDLSKEAFTNDGVHCNSDFLDGLRIDEAKKKMIAWLEKEKKGKGVIKYRLRDWLISRQRYWGAPIPVVYDPEGNAHPVPEEHLPWLLPTDVEFKPTGESPLKASKEFKQRTEKLFGKGWTPEYDTMDTFVCSSFYYLRYLATSYEARGTSKKAESLETRNSKLETLIDPQIERTWMPVSMYIGGPEHACMHLIYARFVMMALKDFAYVTHDEPFKKLVHQGLITNQGAKMSKSKGNVVSPDSFIDKHGSDVFRMYLMFMGPFTDGGDWSDTGIKGVDRFAQRMYRLVKENKKVDQDSAQILGLREKTVRKVSDDIQALRFNTAISALMEFLNGAEKEEGMTVETLQKIVLLLAPLAPHLSEELWEVLGGKGFAIEQAWPAFDASLIKETSITIVVQVNGKLRAELSVSPDIAEANIIAQAKAHPNVQKFLEGKEPKKAIYVKGKLVSLVQ